MGDDWDESVFNKDEDYEDLEGMDQDLDFKEDFKNRGSKVGTSYVEGVSKKLQRSFKTPHELTIEILYSMMADNPFSKFTAHREASLIAIIEKLRNIHLYNPALLISTSIWIITSQTLTKSNIAKFSKETNVNPIDLLRYIRIYNAI